MKGPLEKGAPGGGRSDYLGAKVWEKLIFGFCTHFLEAGSSEWAMRLYNESTEAGQSRGAVWTGSLRFISLSRQTLEGLKGAKSSMIRFKPTINIKPITSWWHHLLRYKTTKPNKNKKKPRQTKKETRICIFNKWKRENHPEWCLI